MTAPFPDFATAGGTAPTQVAQRIFGHYTWMARWSEEIVNEPDLNLKKLAQLAFVHCREFDALIQPPVSDDLAAAVISRFMADGLEWPDVASAKADFAALKSGAATLYAWVVANASEAMDYATLSMDENGVVTETANLVSPKPNAVHNQVAALRALFT